MTVERVYPATGQANPDLSHSFKQASFECYRFPQYSESKIARRMAIDAHSSLIDNGGRYTASGLLDGGRFPNPFLRDTVWGVAHSLPQEGNKELYKMIVPPTVETIDLFIDKVRPLSLESLMDGKMPYLPAHEIHDKYTPQEKAQKLAEKGWGVRQQDKDGNWNLSLYEADDAPAMLLIGAELAINGLEETRGRDIALAKLNKWWPVLEQVALYDIFYADREGDGLIKTYSSSTNKLINRTWRDSPDAFKYNSRRPKGPLAYFANNAFAAKGFNAMANLASFRGEAVFAETLKRLRDKKIELLHDKYWWEEENCFVPALDGNGKQLRIVTNESMVGLFTGTLYTNEARKSARRMLEDDLLTDIGVRTRSINDPNFGVEGKSAYHNGPVYGHANTTIEIGCRNYGFHKEADLFREPSLKYVLDYDLTEVLSVDKQGEVDYYRRGGKIITSTPQFWLAQGIIGMTARDVEPYYPKAA